MFQLTMFWRSFFTICCKFSKKIFFYRSVNSDKPNFVSFLVFVGAAASFTAKISFFETVVSKDILSYASQSECVKIAIF